MVENCYRTVVKKKAILSADIYHMVNGNVRVGGPFGHPPSIHGVNQVLASIQYAFVS